MRLGLAFTLQGRWQRGSGRDCRLDDQADSQVDYETPSTIDAVRDALSRLGHDVAMLGDGRPAIARLLDDPPLDAVFNIAEGRSGPWREATLPALYEVLGMRYTHSDPRALLVSHDKHLAKLQIRHAGLPTPDWLLATGRDQIDSPPSLPVIVKPQYEGTSMGIDSGSVCSTQEQIESRVAKISDAYAQPAIVEAFMTGREFSVAVLGTGDSAKAIGAIEPFHTHALAISDWQTKYDTRERGRFRVWTDGESRLSDACLRLAEHVHAALDLRDVSRIDLRCDETGSPSFIEANALPGLDPIHGFVPVIASSIGWSYDDLVRSIYESASMRWVAEKRTARHNETHDRDG
ncbi:MAG: hypothetical protein H6832_04685 [Planctomycetes bacterium]|nr:hypothetical protein [Planctomycetota bacterium]MCB9917677.1 hypothetical protein [Planctomycetota bacterium]